MIATLRYCDPSLRPSCQVCNKTSFDQQHMLDGIGKSDSLFSIEYRGWVYCGHQPVKRQKHTTGGIPRWSPTLVLVARFSAYVWQSGRDAQFSLTYGRM
jgi:hypothetical protein